MKPENNFWPAQPGRLAYAISEGAATDLDFKAASKRIVDQSLRLALAGASAFQIREKRLSAGKLIDLSTMVVAALRGTSTKVFVNDRADVAALCGADGVHLPTDGMPPDVIRQSFGSSLMIGVSTHSIEEVREAGSRDADLIVFGPVFETPSKMALGRPQGLELLQKAVEATDKPVIGIGGIDQHNFQRVLEAGASGIAAIRMFGDVPETENVIGAIRSFR